MLKREIMFIIKLSVLQVVRQTWELYQDIWKISFSDNVKNVDSVEICVTIKTISFVFVENFPAVIDLNVLGEVIIW